MLEVSAGVTPVGPVGHIKASDLTLEQWEGTESFQPRRGVIRFDLESSVQLERGERFTGTQLDVAIAPRER